MNTVQKPSEFLTTVRDMKIAKEAEEKLKKKQEAEGKAVEEAKAKATASRRSWGFWKDLFFSVILP